MLVAVARLSGHLRRDDLRSRLDELGPRLAVWLADFIGTGCSDLRAAAARLHDGVGTDTASGARSLTADQADTFGRVLRAWRGPSASADKASDRVLARRLDGAACAAQLREEVAPRIQAFVRRHGRPPGLGVVLAGENPASEVYVRNKIGTVAAAGCRAELFRVAADATLADALARRRDAQRRRGHRRHPGAVSAARRHGRRRGAARVRRHRPRQRHRRVSSLQRRAAGAETAAPGRLHAARLHRAARARADSACAASMPS